MKVVVIGAGIAGLASAALLAQKGYSVTLLEKNSSVGGRAMMWEKKGFRFDMGPSWYQVPEAFEHFFKHFGKTPQDYYSLVKLNPQYKIFFSQKEYYNFLPDLNKNLELFETLEKGSKTRIKSYLAVGKAQFDTSFNHILYKNIESLWDYMNPLNLRHFMKIRIWETLEHFVNSVTKNEKIKKMLSYTVLFVGGSPKNIPALYSLMSYIDLVRGTYYVKGGMTAFISTLETLCKEHKVTIVKNADVSRIITKNGIAIAVQTNTVRYDADIVVSNADYPFTELELLSSADRTYNKNYWDSKTLSPSAFVIYLGLNTKVKNLKHHNLYLADNWDAHFDAIFKTKELPEDPSYYVSCPSKTDNSVAPAGKENIFITVQIPSGISLSENQKNAYFQKIISHLEVLTNENIKDHIEVKRILTAEDYSSEYNAYQNAAIGLATTFKQSMLRPSNKSKKVRNLYYAGQYTAPGAGMPMVLISAEKAVKRILSDFPIGRL